MNLPLSIPSEVRRAALLLHGLAPSDRAWLLAGLPHEQRDLLETLVAELVELGIGADPALVAELVDEAPAVAGSQDAPRLTKMLSEAQFAALAHGLATEPAVVVASLLCVLDAGWHRPVLAALSPRQRMAVDALMRTASDAGPPAGLADALRAAISARLASVPAASQRPPLSGWRDTWRKRFAALRRSVRMAGQAAE